MRASALAVLLLLAGAAGAAPRRASPPPPEQVLLRSLEGPGAGYEAFERVQIFPPGERPRGMRGRVWAGADGAVRRERRSGRGRQGAAMILLKDGANSIVALPRRGLVVSGPEAREDAGRTLERLRALYQLSIRPGGRMARRLCWRVDLTRPGGARRVSLWIDRESGLVLKREDYRPDGSLARRERLGRVRLPAEPDPERFRAPAGKALARGAFWLPEGFLPLGSAEGGTRRYSDGARSLSVEPASGSPEGERVSLGGREYVLAPGGAGVSVRAGGSWRRVAGEDVALEDLLRVAQSLGER